MLRLHGSDKHFKIKNVMKINTQRNLIISLIRNYNLNETILLKEDRATVSEFHGLITRSAKRCSRTLTLLLFKQFARMTTRVVFGNLKKSDGM